MERATAIIRKGDVVLLESVGVSIWRSGTSWLGHIHGLLSPGTYEIVLADGRTGAISVNSVQVETGAGQMVSFAGVGDLPMRTKRSSRRGRRKA